MWQSLDLNFQSQNSSTLYYVHLPLSNSANTRHLVSKDENTVEQEEKDEELNLCKKDSEKERDKSIWKDIMEEENFRNRLVNDIKNS